EESLVGEGALLHDAGNAGEVEVQQRERQGTLQELLLADRERKGAIQGDNESSLHPLCLELLEVEEQERFDPRVLVKASVSDVPVLLSLADLERGRPDEGRKGCRRGSRARHQRLTGVRVQVDRCHRPEKLPAFANIGRRLVRLPASLERAIQIREEVILERLRG